MKTKSSFFVALSFAVLACDQVNFDDDFAASSDVAEVSNVNFDVSYQTLLTLLNLPSTNQAPRAVETIETIVYKDDTLMYLVNFQNNQGWELIAADKRLPIMLAENEEGGFEIKSLPPGLSVWLDDLANRIYELKQTDEGEITSREYQIWLNIETYSNYLSGAPTQKIIDQDLIPIDEGYWTLVGVTTTNLPTITVGPFTQTKWGQGYPWNTCVPFTDNSLSTRCPAGCVAIAGAQMGYFLHDKLGVPVNAPGSGVCYGYSDGSSKNYSFSFSNFSSSVWGSMAHYYYSSGTNYAAYLIGYIGMNIDMDYDEEGSATGMGDLMDFYDDWGISCGDQDYSSSTVLSSLNNGYPVIVSADRKYYTTFLGINIPHYRGHAWIIDGYESRRVKYTYYYEWVGLNTGLTPLPELRTSESISTTKLFIMNWGYSGDFDSNRYTLTGDWTTYSDRNYLYDRETISGFSIN